MCNHPVPIRNKWGDQIAMGQCRKCEKCLARKRRHWTGRLLAEQQTAVATWFVTLTYGGGYENAGAYVLNYKHVKDMVKRMRKAGHRFRYVAVGEHGDSKDRGHWHLLMYWQSEPPADTVFDERHEWEFWPAFIRGRATNFGVAQIEHPRSVQGSASYIMKYLDKDPGRVVFKFSKVPALGEPYLIDYARKHAEHGLALFSQGDWFTIPDNRASSGNLFTYEVGRQSALYERMLLAYCERWAQLRPHQSIPSNERLDDFVEDLQCGDVDLSPALANLLDVTTLSAPKPTTYHATGVEHLALSEFEGQFRAIYDDGEIRWLSDPVAEKAVERLTALPPNDPIALLELPQLVKRRIASLKVHGANWRSYEPPLESEEIRKAGLTPVRPLSQAPP